LGQLGCKQKKIRGDIESIRECCIAQKILNPEFSRIDMKSMDTSDKLKQSDAFIKILVEDPKSSK